MNNTKGYFEINVDVDDLIDAASMGIEDVFFLKDLEQRKLFFNVEVEQCAVSETVRYILQYNKEDKGIPTEERKPILLYICSNGGDVDSGFELIDTIRMSKTPVYTINLGYQYSMGFLIGIAGHKRYASSTAKFLMHDGTNLVYNSGAKAQDQMEFNKRMEERVKEYVLSRSNITEAAYDSKMRVEWYMFADEAKDNGFVDYIIGVDCDIDEVI